MPRLATGCLLVMLSASAICAQESPALSPEQVVEKMIAVYASCTTYSDTGRVKTVFSRNMSRPVLKPFSTAFVRPSRFRFEFKEEREYGNNNFVAWQDGTSIKSWWSIKPGIKLYENISFALGSAAGISSGSSMWIPSMLLKLGDTQRIQKLSGLKMSDDKIDGRPTYKVEGKDWRDNPMTLWIDKENFLVLQIYEKQKTERFEAEQTTNYKPRINAPVTPEQLTFGH